MIYPNGFIEISKLKKMVESPLFNVYVEDDRDQPEDWDWQKQGIYRGKQYLVKDLQALAVYMPQILNDDLTICYEPTDAYYEKHPHAGEHHGYVKPAFHFQFSGKDKYEIRECTVISKAKNPEERKKVTTLEVLKFSEDFESACCVIALWDRDDEGYEFRSIGSRLFQVDADDFGTLWEGINGGDKYLHDLYDSEGT